MKKLTALLAGLFFILVLAAAPNGESSEDYIIGARDILYVNVWGEDEMVEKVEVAADGTIPFFYVGKVKVAGLSISQAREHLNATLANGYIRNPVIILKMEEYRSKEVQIQGAIANPGTYVLTTNYTTILKLISMAGGATQNRGNQATVSRGEVWLEMERAKAKTAPATAPAAGDTAFGWDASTSAGATAAPAAGNTCGQDRPAAPPANAQVVVDLRGLLDRGDYSQDIRIYPGDIVLIGDVRVERPDTNYVFVEGAVRNPQKLEFTQGMTALQAVIQSGGLSDVASPNRATITRVGPDGVPVAIRIRLRDIQRGKLPDVPLQAGDHINIPESIF